MKALILALSFLLTQAPQTQDGAMIEGFVSRLGTSDPIARARVVLSKDGGPPSSMTATTDGSGKFTFSIVTPGKYRLFASRDGYVRAEYGQRGPSLPGTAITLTARQSMKDVRMALTATGAIAGRVYDRYGDPVGNANIQALKYSYQDGRRVLSVVQSARTNDLGEYRMFWMQPGQYIISAVPSENRLDGNSMVFDFGPGSPVQFAGGALPAAIRIGGNVAGAAGLTSAADTGETYLTVYYPGTTDASSAAPIDLRPGANFTGVDLSVVDTKAVRVRGRVVSNRPGQPGASVTLVPRGTVVGNGQLQRTAAINDQGVVEFKGIAPGSYDLIATSGRQVISFTDSSTGPNGQTTVTRQAFVLSGVTGSAPDMVSKALNLPDPNEPRLFGRVPLDVGNSDIDDVSIPLQQGFRLSGKVTLDSPTSNPDALANTRVVLRPEPMIPQMTALPAAVSANGTFTVSDLMPGDYRLTLSPMPRGGYVKSAIFAGADSAGLLIHVDGEPRGSLDILVGANPGSVDVTVQNAKQEAVAGVTVVLVPNGERRQRNELYRTATSDAAGRIHLDGVAPGDYKIFSWENVEQGAWQDPDFIRNFEERGKPLHMGEGGHEAVEVRLIPYG